jgi:hypothetical protein
MTISCDLDTNGPIIVDMGEIPPPLAYLWLVQAAESIKYGTMNIRVVADGQVLLGGTDRDD